MYIEKYSLALSVTMRIYRDPMWQEKFATFKKKKTSIEIVLLTASFLHFKIAKRTGGISKLRRKVRGYFILYLENFHLLKVQLANEMQ